MCRLVGRSLAGAIRLTNGSTFAPRPRIAAPWIVKQYVLPRLGDVSLRTLADAMSTVRLIVVEEQLRDNLLTVKHAQA